MSTEELKKLVETTKTSAEELKKLVQQNKKNTQSVYNAIGERIIQEAKRLIAEGKADEDGRIHIEDAYLHDNEAEYSQGDWDCDPMEWIYIDSDGLNFGNGFGDWLIEDFDFDDLLEFVEYLSKK